MATLEVHLDSTEINQALATMVDDLERQLTRTEAAMGAYANDAVRERDERVRWRRRAEKAEERADRNTVAVDVAERRAEKAEEQFDELAVIHNRVRQEWDEFEWLRDDWRERAEQAEADLAEAREVLWALRPVLSALQKMVWISADLELARVKRQHPWIEEWLTGDGQ